MRIAECGMSGPGRIALPITNRHCPCRIAHSAIRIFSITSPLRLRIRRFYYGAMYRFCFRITFQNEEAAFYQFHVFPPVVYLPWVSGWARKRNASTQLILVELKGDDDRDRFLELCCENPHVLKIEEISEEEFTAAPSHII
jgi:hypothetical protein